MKKKKLKKRLKRLETKLDQLWGCHRSVALKVCKFQDLRENMEETINHLNELMADIKEKEFKNGECCKDDIKDLNNRMDGICMDVNSLRSNIERINGRCDILDRRTQTDYDKIIPKGENNGN